MHSHNRKSVLGIALSTLFVLALCPAAFAVPLQQSFSPDGPEAAHADEPDQLELIATCRVQIDETAAQIEEERIAAIEAAKPESVRRAESMLGVPYRSGGSSPSGFDCSGLVSYALTGRYGHAYTSYSFWGMPAVGDPRPGDVVACSPGHCGLYIGNGQMIHAPQSGERVRVEAIRGKIVRP
ncbi:MAG: C40 family peptidase [Coriobacteriales bacterium]